MDGEGCAIPSDISPSRTCFFLQRLGFSATELDEFGNMRVWQNKVGMVTYTL